LSWKSSGGLAKITPVSPPNRKVTKNPTAQSMGVCIEMLPPHMVPIQLKNFTPVGMAISIVMNEKNGRLTAPVVNMWCAQTAIERAPISRVAPTRPT
jgi:hypothetical protein